VLIKLCLDLKAGDILTKDSLIIRRPSYGINPGKLNDILGKKLKADLKFGEPLTDDNLE